VPSFARQVDAIRRGRAPGVLKVGDLSVTRDFSHVDDVVRAYRLLAMHGTAGEAYNVCSGEERSIRSLLQEMLEMAGIAPAIEVDPFLLRAAELPRLLGDATKLRALGWQPSRTVREALRDALDEAAVRADQRG
jgi:GDP-4-dehydro-6-deoxy-D-mannose reductase